MVTHRTFKNTKNEWVEPGDIITKGEKILDLNGNEVIFWKYRKDE